MEPPPRQVVRRSESGGTVAELGIVERARQVEKQIGKLLEYLEAVEGVPGVTLRALIPGLWWSLNGIKGDVVTLAAILTDGFGVIQGGMAWSSPARQQKIDRLDQEIMRLETWELKGAFRKMTDRERKEIFDCLRRN
jgi:hypothetical protein